MRPKDCAYIVERLAIRFMALVADHERQLSEHRTSFGSRTEADAKIIAGLRSTIGAARMAVLERDSLISERAKLQSIINEQSASAKEAGEKLGWTGNESAIQAVERVVKERDGLLTQVQDMRAEIERLQWENKTMHKDAEDGYAAAIKVLGDPVALSKERDALRAEVAALQERLRASIARGDFAQMEVAALKSQTPNQHGRWVRATSEKCTHAKAGEVVSVRGYLVRTNSGEFLWEGKDCEPCDPPQTAPVPKRAHPVAVGGYLRRLTGFNTTPAGEVARVTLVDDDDASHLEYEVVRPNGEKGRWSAKGCEPCDPPEATHDTEAGKAAAESAVKTEPVADEIKVGDVAKVVGASGDLTAQSDIGKIGEVLKIDFGDGTVLLSGAGWVNRCDVRKVTT